jgi:hypothetical protein
MKAKLIPIVVLILTTASLFLATFALRTAEDQAARHACLSYLERPTDPDASGYGQEWISYSSGVKMCMGMP